MGSNPAKQAGSNPRRRGRSPPLRELCLRRAPEPCRLDFGPGEGLDEWFSIEWVLKMRRNPAESRMTFGKWDLVGLLVIVAINFAIIAIQLLLWI
jgi:hypothetical protein